VRFDYARARLIGPSALFFAAFLIGPLAILLAVSFWTMPAFQLIPGFTLLNYLRGTTSDLYSAILIRTVVLGFVTAALVVPIAYALAYLLRFVFTRRAQLILSLVLISMFSGYLVRIYAWRTILGREGLLNSALMQLGVIHEPLTFISYNQGVVVIILVGILIPLVLLPIYSSMANVGKDHLEVARDLGATTFRLHRTVVLPMVIPGVATGFTIAFILAAGDFVVPEMAGGAQSIMIGNVIADQFKGVGSDWPFAASLAFIIIAATIPTYYIATRVLRLTTRW
jgi:spermidine/putrescine transport system permease protein